MIIITVIILFLLLLATMPKDQKLSTLRHRTTLKPQCQATIAPQNDIQIALLPDLSGNNVFQ